MMISNLNLLEKISFRRSFVRLFRRKMQIEGAEEERGGCREGIVPSAICGMAMHLVMRIQISPVEVQLRQGIICMSNVESGPGELFDDL